MTIRSLICTALGAVAILSAALPARAGVFEVSPLVVMLHGGVSSQTITVSNTSAEPLRLQVTGVAWVQSQDGRELTNPTDDLVLFPTLLDIPAGARRAVRVGLANRAVDATERTYRVLLLQLPSAASQMGTALNSGTLEMRVQLSVPIFVAPPRPEAKLALALDGIRNGHLGLRMTNAGNAHAMARSVDVQARDGRGAVVFDRSLKGWYVLAGSDRAYDLPLDPASCAKVRSVRAVVQTDAGVVSRDFTGVEGTCR